MLRDASNENRTEVSVYGEGKVTSRCFAECIIKIKKAFPKLPKGWYDILQDMIDIDNFTDSRLIDATTNLISTCQYPEPTIANILGYDKKKKKYSYDEMLNVTKDFSPEQRLRYTRRFTLKDGCYTEN